MSIQRLADVEAVAGREESGRVPHLLHKPAVVKAYRHRMQGRQMDLHPSLHTWTLHPPEGVSE